MHITTLGDVMLDVIVDVPDGLRVDDDSEAHISLSPGGQAANVASWVVTLGARATLIGPRGTSAAADLVAERLATAGVAYAGVPVDDAGTVVSILASGTRTMASDAGDQTWLSRVDASALPSDCDWLHISAYPLLRSKRPEPVLAIAAAAHRHGGRVSLDLSSASLIRSFGVEAFSTLLATLAPELVFATCPEWSTLGRRLDESRFDVVLKNGPQGATFVAAGMREERAAHVVDVVDATGAGDALAAGYLVGGAHLAMVTAARCVGQRGAQP